MKLEHLRKLLSPVITQFRETVYLPFEGGQIQVGVKLPSAADEAEINAQMSESTSEVLKEIQEHISTSDGKLDAKFDPITYQVVNEKIKTGLAQLRSARQLFILSRAVYALGGDEIPLVVEDESGNRIERFEAVYEVLSELPDEALSFLTGVYRALLVKAEATFASSQIEGTVDAVIEATEARLQSLKTARDQNAEKVKQQVEEVAQMNAMRQEVPAEDVEDIPEGARITMDESPPESPVIREHFVPKTNPDGTPVRQPLNTAPVNYGDTSSPQESVGIVSSRTAETPLPTIPAPPKQSVNPRFNPRTRR